MISQIRYYRQSCTFGGRLRTGDNLIYRQYFRTLCNLSKFSLGRFGSELYLSKNQISEIPDIIGNLVNLQQLNLTQTR